MPLDAGLLRKASGAAIRWAAEQDRAESAKADYHQAIRQLHLAGASLREIADAMGLSHQRVHQMIEEAGGTGGWTPRRRTPARMECSFCGTSKDEVGRLIAGPGVFICDGCVSLAQQVIEQARSLTEGRSQLDPVAEVSAFVCSFCGKAAAEVTRLVAGPGARICDGCVRFSAEVVAAQAD